jgi:hypothetical protein
METLFFGMLIGFLIWVPFAVPFWIEYLDLSHPSRL